MEQKKLKAAAGPGQSHRELCVGRLETEGGITREEGQGSRLMQVMKACSAPEERGRGRRRNEGPCTLQLLLSPGDAAARSPGEAQPWELAGQALGSCLPAGNADLLILSILQELCVLKKPKYAKTKYKNKPSFQHYQHPVFLNFTGAFATYWACPF